MKISDIEAPDFQRPIWPPKEHRQAEARESFRLPHEVARDLGKRPQASEQALGKAGGDPTE